MDSFINIHLNKILIISIVILFIYILYNRRKRSQIGGDGFTLGGNTTTNLSNLNAQISNNLAETIASTTNACATTGAAAQVLTATCTTDDAATQIYANVQSSCLAQANTAYQAQISAINTQNAQLNTMIDNAVQSYAASNSSVDPVALLDNSLAALSNQASTLTIAALASYNAATQACNDAFTNATTCNISDNDQSMTLTVKANCTLNDSEVSNLQADAQSSMNNSFNTSNDQLTQAVDNLSNANIGGNNTTNTEVKNIITNNVSNILQTSTVNSLLSSISANQTMVLSGEGGTNISGNKQSADVTLIASMLSNNTEMNATISSISAAVGNNTQATGEGLTNIANGLVSAAAQTAQAGLGDLTSVVNNAVDTGGSVAETGINTAGGVANNAIDTAGGVADTGLNVVSSTIDTGILMYAAVIIGAIICCGVIVWQLSKSGTIERLGGKAINTASSLAKNKGIQNMVKGLAKK